MTAPKLRFGEFDGNWSLSSLGKMTTYFKGYAFKSESYKDSGIRVIRVSDLGRDSIKTDNDSIYIEANDASAYENWIIKKDDIIITTVGSKPHLVDSAVGRPIYVKNNNEGLLNQNLLVLRPIDETVDSYFIYAQLLDKKYLTYIELIQRGNANQSNITVKDFQDFETYITSKKEQTKIASFLSAVDEKISQLTQKHALLSQYKQGMMQKLFSQQIRFKADDGSEFGAWEETALSEVVNFHNGKRVPLSESDRQKRQGQFRYYGASSVIDYIDEYIFDGQYILIGEDGANIITRSSPLAFIVEGKFWVNNHAHILQAKNGNNRFLATYLESLNYEKFNSGTAQPKLNLENLKKVPVINPCLEEQTKIADFLSAIDQKIEVVAQQIEQAKVWKKGLLQQMFV